MKKEIINILLITVATILFLVIGGTIFFLIAKYFKWLYEVLGI